MSSLYEVGTLCEQLMSSKITERKKALENFLRVVQHEETIENLNRNGEKSWTMVLTSVHKYLIKETDKSLEDRKKKGTSVKVNGGIFYDVVKLIVKEGRGYDVQEILKCILNCLELEELNQLCSMHYLNALRSIMLPNEYVRCHIEAGDWDVVYRRLRRNIFEKNFELSSIDSKDVLETIALYLKFGPLHGFSTEILRGEFNFVSKLCKTITTNSPRSIQIAVVEIVYYFCCYTAKDNRMSCCKFGEETFSPMISLYEIQNPRLDGMKLLLIKYLLMQLVLHNPRGISEGHPGAYAYSWEKWNSCLKSIHKKCRDDICHSMKLYPHYENPLLFLVEKETKYLQYDFGRLFAEVIRQLEWKLKDEGESSHEERKKRKIGTPIMDLIDLIEESQYWPWINEMCILIQLYPDVLNEGYFIHLLQILSKLQVDCKDKTVAHYIYCCLSLLLDIQASLNLCNISDVRSTWTVIQDTTLRAFGLNQNDPELHNLLQKLIINNNNLNPEMILRTYTSDVLDVTEYNLQTLEVTFINLTCPQNVDQNQMLLKWILSRNAMEDYSYLSNPKTSIILVSLIVKKWPTYITEEHSIETKSENKLFDDIADIYMKTEFEDSLLSSYSIKTNRDSDAHKKGRIELHDDCSKFLINSLQRLIQNVTESQNESKKLVHFVNIIGLIKNVMCYLLNFKLMKEDEVEQNILFEMMNPIFERLNVHFNNIFTHKKFDDLKIASLNEAMVCFHKILSTVTNIFFDRKFREVIPTALLQTLFSFLNISSREKTIDFVDLRLPLQNLRILVIRTLVTFSFGMKTFLTPNQSYMFHALAEFDYRIDEYTNCDLPMTFLRTIRECKPDNLTERSIKALLSLLLKLCETRYKYYSCATEILEFLHEILLNISSSASDESKHRIIDMLFPFYTIRNNYGPDFVVTLVNCIGKLYQIDPERDFAKWDGVEVILKLPQFICSKHQEVRFATLKNLIKFFEISSSRKNLKDYHLQEIVFADICEKCEKIFDVEGSLSEERKIDETVTRSASVLHILSSILVVSNLWREESLFAMFKLVHKRRLESFSKVLKMVSKHLLFEDEYEFLDKYSNVLLRRWMIDGLDLDDFPITLFGCDNKTSFYTKYLLDVVPFLIQFDKASLNEIVECTGKTMLSILKESFPVLCVNSIISFINNLSQDVFLNSELVQFVLQHIGEEQFKSLFMDKIDLILLNLISAISDERYFSNKFQVPVMFIRSSSTAITVENFEVALNFLEDNVCPGKSLVPILMTQHVDKLQQIMMQLNMNIHNSIAVEDKLKTFQHYTIVNDSVIQSLNLSQARDYFIRDTCYVLLRLVKNHAEYPDLGKVALIYLKKSLADFLEYSEILNKHFVQIVTTLVDNVIEKKDEKISELSLDVLKFLILENAEHFRDTIKNMDNFPKNQSLTELSRCQSDLKYDGKETHLKDEIQNFVNSGSISRESSSRLDTLKNLKEHLFCEKRQLKNLYRQLSDLNGFSEDCEKSLLHQLMGLLVDLSHSTDKDVSMEALKCLGELGPSDLMTLIVRPEKHLTYTNSTPLEFFTGQIISLLNIYLIDIDVNLVYASSVILYNALNTKEGRKILDANEDFGQGRITGEYLFPFLLAKNPKSSTLKVDVEQLISKINSDQVWCPTSSVKYNDWIRILVCNILESVTDNYLPQLISICKLKVEFCEVLLPSLVYLLISLNIDKINRVITQKINKFFENHWTATMDISNNNEDLIIRNKKAVQVMLGVVHFFRVNKSNMKLKKDLDDLDLDYLRIAKAAQYCSAHFTSLLYVELWCYSKVDLLDTRGATFKSTLLDCIHETEREEISLAVINILKSSYKAIGDQDSLQGCGNSFLLNPQLRVEHYKDSGMWDQAILFYNMQISRGVTNSRGMLIESFKHCGLFEASLFCKEQQDIPDYECMWRLSDWTLPDTKGRLQNNQITFEEQMEKFKYFTLKSVHERDVFSVMEHIENARSAVVEKLKHTSLESSCNLYSILTYLQGFNEIEDFLNAEFDDLQLVLRKWSRQDDIAKNNFSYIEPIMAQRIVLLNDFFKKSTLEDSNFYRNSLIEFSLKLSEIARSENKTHIGTRAVAFLQNLPRLTQDEKSRIYLEDAQLCWITNNKLTGRKILNQLSDDLNISPRLRSSALKLNGKWSVESYSEHPNTIIKDYFLASLALCKDLDKNKDDLKSIFDTYDTLGRFADREYQQVAAHMASDIFQKKVINMQKATTMVKQLSKKNATLEEKKAKAFHEKQSSIDQAEIENTRKEKDAFLKMSLQYYLQNLSYSDNNNLQIFRVMALFLENRSCNSIHGLIEEHLPRIPSYKFLNILPQLIPHIANRHTDDFFSQQANSIIERCAREHPHHTLPFILALANSHKDSAYNKSNTNLAINEERVVEARKMIKALKNNSVLTDIITRLEILSDALVELAYLAPPTEDKYKKKKIAIPRSSKILSIKNFTSIPVLTDNLPVRVNANYDDIVGIHSYEKHYDLVGGNNLPKKILCRGTDGILREELVKGQDDLRQDAVMEQVFTIINSLLSLNKQSCGLKIRTYKIVPLSMRSGILEWAQNTMPIGTYLVGDADGNTGAHQTYRPQDQSPSRCRRLIADAAKYTAEKKLLQFNAICENFKPVFHKFFEESFLYPTVWYERRRAYIHSVATTSMCGYILGIGDRHVSNILIDKTTAEVVHIDFGIAFEQGRTLPTPETVPFRLTRDFVDGMGISGVEGAFRRSCEKTMTVMRDNYQTIMAILEVLLYDPLYSWTVSAAEAKKRQHGSLDESTSFRTSPQICDTDISINTTAERALMRLKAKLHGIEEGMPMSVEHQVNVLIHQAMDPGNLCKLFQGWQAYL